MNDLLKLLEMLEKAEINYYTQTVKGYIFLYINGSIVFKFNMDGMLLRDVRYQ